MNIVLDVLRYLNEHDITLVKAAEATGVAQQNIKKSIGNNPKTSTLLALAKGLGVDPREFFYDLDEKEKKNNNIQENVEENLLLENPEITEEETKEQKDVEDPVQSDYAEEASNTEEERPADIEEKDKAVTDNIINTTTFCPHCGAKVRVGVVLLPEE